MKLLQILGISILTGAAVACAGAPRPTDQLANTEAALRASSEVGAEQVPQAQLHATLAREQLEKARKAMEEDDNARAKRLLERAQADAELALALAREHQARQAAENAEAQLQSAQQTPAQTEMHVQAPEGGN